MIPFSPSGAPEILSKTSLFARASRIFSEVANGRAIDLDAAFGEFSTILRELRRPGSFVVRSRNPHVV